jgi:hypothetical protein
MRLQSNILSGVSSYNGLKFGAAAIGNASEGFTIFTGGYDNNRLTINASGNATFGVDARAPIFYDSNNTGYYIDGASTSNLNVVNANMFNGKITILGGTSSVIGQVQTSSSINLGIAANAYAYGISTNNSGGLDIMANQSGQPIRFWSGSINENPTKSADFNGTTVTFYGSTTSSEYYVNGWFRNNGSNTGLYNQANGNHFYSRGSNRWGITGNSIGSDIYLDFYANHQTNYRGSVHADTVNSIGFLTDNSGWGLRVTNNKSVYIHGTDLHVNADNASYSNIVMHDGDEGDRTIHCNSNRIGFLNQSASWGAYCSDNGDWTTDTISWAGASMRAPIFYDSNDTGYYLDAASNSSLNILSIGGHKTLSALGGNGITGTINAVWGLLKSSGYKMYPDEQFTDGNNGVSVYNNNGGSGITITRKNSGFNDSNVSPMPNSSGWVLEIRHAPGESSGTSPGFGGFTFSTYTGPGSKRMICTFKMKIPAGRTIEWASNSIGSNGGSQWLTSNVGTGQYQDYAYLVNSGTSGWSSTFFFYIVGGSSSTFYTYLASATVYDITNVGEESTRIYTATASVASPIYYDLNDTGYYLNPNGNSNISTVSASTIYTSNFYQNANGYFQFGFTNTNTVQWPLLRFGPYETGWDEGIIKASTAEGVFGRYGLGIHMDSARAFGIYSSGWNKVMGFKSDAVQSYQPVTAPSLQLSGALKQGGTLARPSVQWGASGNVTGAVVIKLPGSVPGNYGMIHAVIDIYEYNSNNVCTVTIGGHNWSSQWYNYGAEVVGNTNKQVRLAIKDGKYCIVLGDGSSTWEYGQVILRKIQNGTYYDGVMDLGGAYSIGIESDSYSWVSGNMNAFSSTNVSATSAMYSPIYYDGTDTGYYVDPAWSSVLYNLTLIGAKSTYLYINPGTGYEAMLRVQGGSGSSWYAGKRTTSTTQAGTDGFHFYSDAGGDTVVGFGTDGTIKAKGDVVAYSSSDRQLKDNILPIENALEKVKQIGGYTFNWNDKQTIYEGHDIGVIAQEIESVLPEVVTTRDTGFKAVKYEKIVPLLIEAIKEQQTQIEELKQLVNQLINK